jgi:hypothetical protein
VARGAARGVPSVMPDIDDVEWLTLTEAAARLNISRDSVRRLVRRQHWARRPGNDGCVRIAVPIERLSRNVSGPGADPGPSPGEDPGHDLGRERTRIATLEATVTGLNALVAEAGKRADAADRRADELRQERDLQVAVLNAVLDEMRRDRDEIRRDRDHWREAAMTRRSWWPWRRLA